MSVARLSRIPFPKERLFCDLSRYLIANRPSFSEEHFFSKVQDAVRGGVSCVQLRDHTNDVLTILRTAERLKEICKSIPLFINTLEAIKVAKMTKAQGIYLEKGPFFEARKILGEKAVIGIPIKTLEEVRAVGQINAIDYLSVKVFASKKTCLKNDQLWGMEGLRKVRTSSPHRLVAVGGINLESIEMIYKELDFDDGIAMASGLMDDPCFSVQKMVDVQKKVRKL